MAIREITDSDLGAVRDLLVEGFPLRSADYWSKGLANLGALPPVDGFPRYGYVIDADGGPQGVLLTLTSDRGGHGARTSLSSWYVRDRYRQTATFLFRHVLKLKNTTFVNVSPADHVLPIVEAFGFEPYTTGMVMLDLRAALLGRSPRGAVRRIDARGLGALSDGERQLAADHLRMGCDVLRLQADNRAGLLIHRRRWIRRALPASQVIFADPELMTELAGPVMRTLVRAGSVLAFCDVGQAPRPAVGRVFPRAIRYFKGAVAPPVADLAYSELAVFGP
jgi:hypothetical protein